MPQRPYDPDKAAFHFKKAGMANANMELQVSEGAFSGATDCAVLYQEAMKKAGIDLNVKRVSGDGYWDNVWLKVPFCAVYWGGRPTRRQPAGADLPVRRATGTTRTGAARSSTSCSSTRAPNSTRPSAARCTPTRRR